MKRMAEDKADMMKLRELFYNYAKGEVELPYPPLGIRIEPTNYCNLQCQMCPQSLMERYRKKGFMNMELYKNIIDEMREFPKSKLYPHITLYLGGEPLLHKNIIEMIRIAKEAGFSLHLNTNCVLLTTEMSLNLFETGIDLIGLSFDDLHKEKYEDFRRNANYDLVLDHIINLLKIKKENGFDKTIVKIVGLRINRENTSTSPKITESFIKKFDGLPLDGIDISQVHLWSGEFKKKFIGKEERINKYYPCYMLWRDITIAWDGKVMGCCYDLLGEQVIGDVTKNKIIDIWNNGIFKEIRRKQINGEYYKISLCKGCELLSGKVDVSHFWGHFYPFISKYCNVKSRWG